MGKEEGVLRKPGEQEKKKGKEFFSAGCEGGHLGREKQEATQKGAAPGEGSCDV